MNQVRSRISHRLARVPKRSRRVAERGIVIVSALAMTAVAAAPGVAAASSGASTRTTITFLSTPPYLPSSTTTQTVIRKFETENPSIHVNLEFMTQTEMETGVLATRLGSGAGPDVFIYTSGGFAVPLVKAGLLMPLNSILSKLPTFSPWALPQITYNGKVIMAPSEVSTIGLFYNKALFAKYHLSVPTSVAGLTALCKPLEAAGLIPISMSAQIAGYANHLFSEALSSRLGSAATGAIINGSASWNTASVVATLQDSFTAPLKAGCFEPSPDSVSFAEAESLFFSGKAALFATGTWIIPDIVQSMKDPVGYFNYPAANGTGIPTGSLGAGYMLSAKSKHLAAAEKFLEFLCSPYATSLRIKNDDETPAYAAQLPSGPLPPLLTQAVKSQNQWLPSKKSIAGYNIDAVDNNLKVIQAEYNGLEGLLNGTTTAAKAAASIEAAKG